MYIPVGIFVFIMLILFDNKKNDDEEYEVWRRGCGYSGPWDVEN